MIEYQITRAGVGRKFQNPSTYEDLTVLENLEISYPKKRNVFGSLFFRPHAEIVDKIESVARRDLPARISSTPRPACSRTGRSSGWRSACC